MAQLQKYVVWLVQSRSVTVVVVVTWPVLFALAPGFSFHFAPPIAVRLVSKRSQLWHPRHSRPNKLRLFMVSEPTQAKPPTQTLSSRSIQLAGLDRPIALSPRVRSTQDSRPSVSPSRGCGAKTTRVTPPPRRGRRGTSSRQCCNLQARATEESCGPGF